MCFRELTPEQAAQIIDFCEANNIEYDIWNAGDVWMGVAKVMELGTDWERIPKEMYS